MPCFHALYRQTQADSCHARHHTEALSSLAMLPFFMHACLGKACYQCIVVLARLHLQSMELMRCKTAQAACIFRLPVGIDGRLNSCMQPQEGLPEGMVCPGCCRQLAAAVHAECLGSPGLLVEHWVPDQVCTTGYHASASDSRSWLAEICYNYDPLQASHEPELNSRAAARMHPVQREPHAGLKTAHDSSAPIED